MRLSLPLGVAVTAAVVTTVATTGATAHPMEWVTQLIRKLSGSDKPLDDGQFSHSPLFDDSGSDDSESDDDSLTKSRRLSPHDRAVATLADEYTLASLLLRSKLPETIWQLADDGLTVEWQQPMLNGRLAYRFMEFARESEKVSLQSHSWTEDWISSSSPSVMSPERLPAVKPETPHADVIPALKYRVGFRENYKIWIEKLGKWLDELEAPAGFVIGTPPTLADAVLKKYGVHPSVFLPPAYPALLRDEFAMVDPHQWWHGEEKMPRLPHDLVLVLYDLMGHPDDQVMRDFVEWTPKGDTDVKDVDWSLPENRGILNDRFRESLRAPLDPTSQALRNGDPAEVHPRILLSHVIRRLICAMHFANKCSLHGDEVISQFYALPDDLRPASIMSKLRKGPIQRPVEVGATLPFDELREKPTTNFRPEAFRGVSQLYKFTSRTGSFLHH
ncbi:hypothetical protein CXG81DRAFT_19955 [Caulochytrium protostelioides]|uniref:Uncharacterized protein n=1 Tax=Caulochytrium protostelioides TaxID=1555241 RepID=A0A4P9X4N4_9FUNG|nr:hypothetical protein CXG81DRAFT_19955 [Caulochytrium protostelioides]|eukprot:RKP00047.1 hypothetical protein CXG81DRAFT_19955 [Caulochytrium protostelioides]